MALPDSLRVSRSVVKRFGRGKHPLDLAIEGGSSKDDLCEPVLDDHSQLREHDQADAAPDDQETLGKSIR